MSFLLVLAACTTAEPSQTTTAEPSQTTTTEPSQTTTTEPSQTTIGESQEVRIAVFLGSQSSTYWEAGLNGAREAAEEHGNVTITEFGANFDPLTQKNQLRDALVSGAFDAWWIGPNDGNLLVPEIEQAIQNGIKVACVLVPCGPDVGSPSVQIEGMTAYVGQSFPDNGAFLAQLVVEACADKDPCKAVFMPGLAQNPFELSRLEGIESVLRDHENIVLVASQPGNYSANDALAVMQNVLQANPDVDVFFSSGDTMSLGAENAVEVAGKSDQVTIIGNGCSVEGLDKVASGAWGGCVVYAPHTEGKIAADVLIRAVRGELLSGVSIDPIPEVPVPYILTEENADLFEAEYTG